MPSQKSNLISKSAASLLSAAIPQETTASPPESTEPDNCSICFELMDNAANNPIATYHDLHTFHVQCIALFRASQPRQDVACPLCREPILHPRRMYDQGVERFLALLGKDTLIQGRWEASTEIQKKEMSDIINLWESAANEGELRSPFILGRVYSYGTGVVASLELALKWYGMASEQGSHEALFSMGNMYYEFCAATPKDIQKALHWFYLAAEKNNDKAQKCLGDIYFSGESAIGLQVDHEKAYDWYKKSADNGNAQAQFKLGNMYYKGQFVEQSYTESANWYSSLKFK